MLLTLKFCLFILPISGWWSEDWGPGRWWELPQVLCAHLCLVWLHCGRADRCGGHLPGETPLALQGQASADSLRGDRCGGVPRLPGECEDINVSSWGWFVSCDTGGVASNLASGKEFVDYLITYFSQVAFPWVIVYGQQSLQGFVFHQPVYGVY